MLMNFIHHFFTAASTEGIEKDCSSLSVNIRCFPGNSIQSWQEGCIFVQGTQHNPMASLRCYSGLHNCTVSYNIDNMENKGGLRWAAFVLYYLGQRTCTEQPSLFTNCLQPGHICLQGDILEFSRCKGQRKLILMYFKKGKIYF